MTHGAGKGSNTAKINMRRDPISLFLFTPRRSLRDLDCRSQPSPHFNIQTMPHCSRQIYRDRRVIKLSFSLTVHSQQAPNLSHTHTHTFPSPSSPLDLESVTGREPLDLAVTVSKTEIARFASSLVIWGLFRMLCLFEGGVHTDRVLKCPQVNRFLVEWTIERKCQRMAASLA